MKCLIIPMITKKLRCKLKLIIESFLTATFSTGIVAAGIHNDSDNITLIEEENYTPSALVKDYGCEFIHSDFCEDSSDKKTILFKIFRDNCVISILLPDNDNSILVAKKFRSFEEGCQKAPYYMGAEVGHWAVPVSDSENCVDFTLAADKLIVLSQPESHQGVAKVNVISLDEGRVEKELWVPKGASRFCQDTLYTFFQEQNKLFIYPNLTLSTDDTPDFEKQYQVHFQDEKPILLTIMPAEADLKSLACSIPEEVIFREKRSPLYGCKELLKAAFRLGCENRVITGCSGGANSGGAEAEGSGTCTNPMSGESCTFQSMADGSDAIFSDSVTCPSCKATTGSSGFTECTQGGCMGGCPEPPPPPTTPAPVSPGTKCDPGGQINWTETYYFDCRDAIQTNCSFLYIFGRKVLDTVDGTCINPKSGKNCSFWVVMQTATQTHFNCPDCTAERYYQTFGEEGWVEYTDPINCMVQHYVPSDTGTGKIIGISVGASVGGVVAVGAVIAIFVTVVYKLRHRGYQAITEN